MARRLCTIFFGLILAGTAFLGGCPNNSPSAPAATPTPIPTSTPTPVNIDFMGSVYLDGVPNTHITLALAVNGQPATTAGVTFTYPGGNLSVPFSGLVTYGGTPPVFGEYHRVGGWVFTAGQSCTLTATTSIGVAQGTVSLPGDITVAPDGSQASWVHEGMSDAVQVYFGSNISPVYISPGTDATSPSNIPVSVYSTPGPYRIDVIVSRINNSVSNALLGSTMSGTDFKTANLYVGNTPTPTATATFTPVPQVHWQSSRVNRLIPTSGVESRSVQLFLQVNGSPETTAGVTMSYTGGNFQVPFSGFVTLGVVYAAYNQYGAGWTYQPGQPYTITADTSQGVFSASATAPGGITHAPDGSQVDWVEDGGRECVTVQDPLMALTYVQCSGGTNLTSPHAIPTATAYPTPGAYTFYTRVENVASPVPGLTWGTPFKCEDNLSTTIVIP